ncbi:MAG: DUF4174 domain-containing protein [Bacteroidota bacterium]
MAQDINHYRWKKRVIILVHNDQSSSAFQKQVEVLSQYESELIDRDMIILSPKGEDRHAVLTKLGIPIKFQGVLLVGKDGGVKYKGKYPVLAETLFALVDTMPMRQSEMKRKKGN